MKYYFGKEHRALLHLYNFRHKCICPKGKKEKKKKTYQSKDLQIAISVSAFSLLAVLSVT
jgi:hypothetical protein